MKQKKSLYPGVYAAEKEKEKARLNYRHAPQEPDFIGGAPNYDKFEKAGYTPEKVLVFLNID